MMNTKYIFLLLLSISLFNSCSKPQQLVDIKDRGKLIVLTRNAPTTYYEDNQGNPAGVEYELVESFAKQLGVTVEYVVKDSTHEILEALKNGEGDMAAAGLIVTPERKKEFFWGPTYHQIQQEIVCNKILKIKKISELQKYTIMVTQGSSYEERLKELSKNIKLQIESTSDLPAEAILEEVSQENVDCTIVDSNILAIQQRYLENLYPVYSLGKKDMLAWAFPPNYNFFKKELDKWHSKMIKASTISAILDKYYAHTMEFDYLDSKIFLKRMNTTLPKYLALFKMASKKYKLPWKLLAAVSYQESHWNPKAKSPTGVRGIMMLTQATAKDVNVDDRLDPLQSIMGGGKYLKETIDRIPPYITGDDRIWMGLASYNIGYAHLRDARALAVLQEENPNIWAGVKETLPLLTLKKFYKKLPHGYARGKEPVLYVQRIRNYLELLK